MWLELVDLAFGVLRGKKINKKEHDGSKKRRRIGYRSIQERLHVLPHGVCVYIYICLYSLEKTTVHAAGEEEEES